MEVRQARSSRATEAFEEALVGTDDAGDVRRVRSRVPDVSFEGPAEDDPIGPGEHVAELAKGCVTHLRLWLEDRKLAANRLQLLVGEQFARAETCAIEHEVFAK